MNRKLGAIGFTQPVDFRILEGIWMAGELIGSHVLPIMINTPYIYAGGELRKREKGREGPYGYFN